jgi:hypothetical protein
MTFIRSNTIAQPTHTISAWQEWTSVVSAISLPSQKDAALPDGHPPAHGAASIVGPDSKTEIENRNLAVSSARGERS